MPLQTSSRLLALLGLLQARTVVPATDLATRLGVGERTVRKDVERLRELGYPIDAVRGPSGGYRFGDHGRLPPLLLEPDEAVAVAVGLGTAAAVRGLEQPSLLALGKLEQVLPDRLRRRVRALHESTDVGPANTGTNVEAPVVDVALLAELAAAIRDHEGLRLRYRAGGDHEAEEPIEVDPYRLVSWQERWYVVARSRDGAWRALRVDWLEVRTPGAGRFAPRPMDGGDYAAFVLREVAHSGWSVHCRIAVDASAAEVLRRINPTVGVVEEVDDDHSVLVTGADSVEMVAVWIGMLGLDFHVDEPHELVAHVATLAERYAGAVPSTRVR
ncbi:Predicted DNA-binding transcriptional regulator YafY, contains an HTH and WYL domains [Nocardioides exalbidus]|uniref:Predicted DNA-binding transcriptional regulator YafY, contains an HTH and WYL domains n=1 Tax=Nocardioides exalbidus TaxID=402596 RepID=A0A1H4YIT8_9ACTN|nr:WYL domain-containing protein [Nocardioides exalbidus]SED17859.1 Predicted DNA-binding transcriptional regulator YafY, contains an HTH and WYL domains [Nocardioides exalbidus]